MKKIYFALLYCACVFSITSCALSNEDKAEKLIKETLKEHLFYPDSYESLSTIVDSMYIDPTAIEPIMEIKDDIEKTLTKINECEREIEHAESTMEIFAPDAYSTPYSRGSYKRAKEKKEKVVSDLDKYNNRLLDRLSSLKENVTKYHKGKFTGWIVRHRFRSRNGAGTMYVPGNMVFFCDKEFTSCFGYDSDKLEDFVQFLKVVDEATSFEEILDNIKEISYLL